MRRNSGRHLDAVDKISFWRSHRIDSENWFARLDAKTVRRLVAASDFHAAWFLDFLVGFNRELSGAAKSVGMVRPLRLARSRWILRGLVVGSSCRGALGLRKQAGTFRVPTTGNWKRNFDFSGRRCVSLALLSIQFDFGNCINPSREHPYFTSGRLLSGALIPFAVVYVYGVSWVCRRINTALRSHRVRINRRVRDSLGDSREPGRVCERAQLVSSLTFLHSIECAFC